MGYFVDPESRILIHVYQRGVDSSQPVIIIYRMDICTSTVAHSVFSGANSHLWKMIHLTSLERDDVPISLH